MEIIKIMKIFEILCFSEKLPWYLTVLKYSIFCVLITGDFFIRGYHATNRFWGKIWKSN